MAGEGFEVEEWDADFLDQLVQAEELALSFSVTQPHDNHPPPPPPPPPLITHPVAQYISDISYSPPRELSQRVCETPAAFGRGLGSSAPSASSSLLIDSAKEQEIDRLKGELGRVSKQLSLLEEECLELKRERNKKEEQLKFVSSTTETKEAVSRRNSKNLHCGVSICDNHGIPQECQKWNSLNELPGSGVNLSTSASKAVGIQTEKDGESDFGINFDSFVAYRRKDKLLGIWDSFNGHKFGKDLVSKLFSTCEVDFQVLFGYLNLSLPSKTKIDSLCKPDVPLSSPLQSADAAKVSHLYLTLTKISNEMVTVEELLEVLINLCSLKNGVVFYRSLRVLHAVLKHAFSTRMVCRRDNITFVRPLSEQTPTDACGYQSFDNGSLDYAHTKNILDEGDFQDRPKLSNLKRNSFTPSSGLSISGVDWSSLFELMCQVTMRNREEHVRLEAVSIMNIIVVSCNAYTEREKFASKLAFQSLSQLLRKEAGFHVQKQAVKLLYQLLNCPKVTATFCSGYQEGGETSVTAEIEGRINSTFQEFSAIMEGLADCVACRENSAKELKLRRSAIILLAFIASLGKTGFAIMLNHRLPKRSNILACILQSLLSDVDLEASDSASSIEIFKERTLLLREALILLNRVVSHPQYSVPALQALTSSRDMTSLTTDIAKRLSQKSNCPWPDDDITRQMREYEIIELGWVFKRRVFSFLGDGIQ